MERERDGKTKKTASKRKQLNQLFAARWLFFFLSFFFSSRFPRTKNYQGGEKSVICSWGIFFGGAQFLREGGERTLLARKNPFLLACLLLFFFFLFF